jgi:hypothetical protein
MRLPQGPLRLAILLALPSFVAAHDVIFLVAYGARNVTLALARDGHGMQWMATVVSAAMTATFLLGVGAWRLFALSSEAREASRTAPNLHGPLRVQALAREVLALWPLVFMAAVSLFIAVENLERSMIGQPAPGLAVLASAGYLVAPLILAAVSGLVSLVAALYAWRRDFLIRRIALSRHRWERPPRMVAPVGDPLPHRTSVAGLRLAGRAPPSLAPLPVPV